MLVFFLLLAVSSAEKRLHPAVDNGILAQIRENSPADLLSNSNGKPVSYCEATHTLNQPLIRNAFFLDQLGSGVRERTVGRPVHTKGHGAFGYFEVTNDISHICKASFLNKIGKRTSVAVRFSSGIAERGSTELSREVRGFSIKLHTDEGNFDMPCISTPVFAINHPNYYTKLIYAIRKHASQTLYDPKVLWEFLVQHPEALNMFIWMLSDRGIPLSYRHMPGHNVHSLQVENAEGEQHWMRFHLIPDLGIKHLTTAEAQEKSAADLDYYSRDLYQSIEKGNYPSWSVSVQIFSEEDVAVHGYTLFDVTRELNEEQFPLHPVGKIVLNKNPINFYAEIELLGFSTANLVDGILGAPDKIYEARRFAYGDAQIHRLGPDFNNIPVNRPLNVREDDADSSINYSCESSQKRGLIQIKEEVPNNLDQVEDFYARLPADEKTRLIDNFILGLSAATETDRDKVLQLLQLVDFGLASQVAGGFNITVY